MEPEKRALNSAFDGYYTKNGNWQECGRTKWVLPPNYPPVRTGSNHEPVPLDNLKIAVNESS